MLHGKLRLACLIGVAAVALAVVAAQRLGGSTTVSGNTPADRIEAINRLAGERPNGAAAVIAQVAAGDADAGVRRSAIGALATFQRPEDRTVIDHALDDRDGSVRAVAAEAFGAYGPESVARLRALAQDPDPQVRMGVVAGLVQTGRGPGMALLLQMMSRHGDPEVQIKALHAIESISKLHYLEVPDPRDAALWAHMIERVRNNRWVEEALAAEKSSGDKP